MPSVSISNPRAASASCSCCTAGPDEPTCRVGSGGSVEVVEEVLASDVAVTVDAVVEPGTVVTVFSLIVVDAAGEPIVWVLLHPTSATRANARLAVRLVSMATTVAVDGCAEPDMKAEAAMGKTRER